MPYDFKKEMKELYSPAARPRIVTVPPARYIALEGQGDPNEPGGAYQQALAVLYAVAYTLKTSGKAGREIPGFFEYVVPPLEGFWPQGGPGAASKADFQWVSVLRLPGFVTEGDLEWAKAAASQKKKLDCGGARLLAVDEGLCVQALHTGPYDTEPQTVARLDAYLEENGYGNDMSPRRPHHEIYLSDPRKSPPEKWRTILRHPIRPAG